MTVYVCSLCSQDFTRRWTGKRHNQNIHFGQSNIVRLIDYIAGRISGQYFPADPLEYRKRSTNTGRLGFEYRSELPFNVSRKEVGGGEQIITTPKETRRGFATNFSSSKDTNGYLLSKVRQSKFEFEETNKVHEMTRSEKLDEIRALLQISCKSTEEAGSIFAGVSLQNDYQLDDYWKWLRDSLCI